MSKLARKVQRSSLRRKTTEIEESQVLMEVAVESLGLSAAQASEAETLGGVAADMLTARVLDLLECLNGSSNDHCDSVRADLERRNGAGFLQRVAAMGEPAAEAVVRIRYRRVNFLATSVQRATIRGIWIGSGTRGSWLRRFTHGARCRSSFGRVSARASCKSRGSRRRSSSGSISRHSTRSNSSARGSRNTPSGEPAERSSGLLTLRRPLSPRCASPIGARPSALARLVVALARVPCVGAGVL